MWVSAYVQLRVKLPEDFWIAEETATWVFWRTLEVAGRCCDWLLSTKSISVQRLIDHTWQKGCRDMNTENRQIAVEPGEMREKSFVRARRYQSTSVSIHDVQQLLHLLLFWCGSLAQRTWYFEIHKDPPFFSEKEQAVIRSLLILLLLVETKRKLVLTMKSSDDTKTHEFRSPWALMSARMAACYCATRKEEISHVDSYWNPGGAGSVSSLHCDFSLM